MARLETLSEPGAGSETSMNILFTFGIGEDGKATVLPDENGQMNIYTEGTCNVFGMMDLGPYRPLTVLLYGPNTSQPAPQIPQPVSLVFNQLSDADSHRTALERCADLCATLDAPVINHPERVLATTRDGVARLLADIPGLRVPACVALQPKRPADILAAMEQAGIGFPVVLRIAGDHNAASLVRLENEADLQELHAMPLDGRRYYLAEYVDFADDSGVYHKHRVVMIDGKPMVRHAMFGDDWKINSSCIPFMRSHPEFGAPLANTQRVQDVLLPRAESVFREIHRRIGLDYFGIDCRIDENGEVLVFEANATMNILLGQFIELESTRRQVEQRLFAMIGNRIRQAPLAGA